MLLYMESIQIYINSKTADKFNNNKIADAQYILPTIEIPDGFHIYLSLQKASIPHTFYNINMTNNLLDISDNTNNIISYIIPVGNYNMNQLVSYLQTTTGINIQYNSITNKLTFTNTKIWNIQSSSTILSILGFNDVTTVQSSLTFIIESIHCANLASVKTINIATNVTTMNINKAIPNNNSIIASIPVNSPPYSIIQYENANNCRANLYINSLSMLNIKLIDDLGYLIDLNGVHYSMTFQIDIVSFR